MRPLSKDMKKAALRLDLKIDPYSSSAERYGITIINKSAGFRLPQYLELNYDLN